MSESTIYIIDDNEVFRDSIAWMIAGLGYEVRSFGNPHEALSLIEHSLETGGTTCSTLLVDVRMPEMSGLDVHDKLIAKNIRVPVIYMTGHGDVSLAVEAMKKGAITFLEKPIEVSPLEQALSKGVSQYLKQKAIGLDLNKVSVFQDELNQLTPRETEVMHAIVEGKANKVTAIDLGISIKTVELHRSRVMKKLPVRSSQELVKMVMLCP